MTNPSEHDGQTISHTYDQARQTRIATLLIELAAIGPARRRDDQTRRQKIETELVLLLDAEILSWRMARNASTATALPPDRHRIN